MVLQALSNSVASKNPASIFIAVPLSSNTINKFQHTDIAVKIYYNLMIVNIAHQSGRETGII